MDSRRASEQNVSFFDDPHPERLSPPIGEVISKLILFLVAMSLVPFVCAELSEEWRLSVLTSGIVLEFFAGVILYFAHLRWQARRRDYCLWLRLVHRRMSDR
jgi:hypothetical protein